jgi:subfamily B ATP-binding cassette protein HlyB/CyaB
LRLQGVAAEPAQLHHQLGLAGKPVGVVEMLRCARQLGLKARSLSTRWARLARTPLPGIAELRDGSFLLVAKATADKVLVHVPGASQAEVMTKEQFEGEWTGRLVLMMRRARLGDVARRFDIGWFAGALNKYRGLLSEVLLASFFLQLFALLTPLFFQVVIDKVLVHRSLTTLEVVMVAIVGFAVAETLLGIMRTYLFAHTTNRVDVELGARRRISSFRISSAISSLSSMSWPTSCWSRQRMWK